ncbi:MAG: lysophospholipid acyltransferase family protein, partial [Nannocystaceae bacterium]
MSWVVIPLVQLFVRDPERRTAACARLMVHCTHFFFWWMRTGGLIQIKHGPVPADLPPSGEPYVMLANHPSLVDSVLLMGSFYRLNTVAKPSYYNSWMVGRFLRATGNLCAPTPNSETPFGATLVLDLMVKHLKAGKALLVFPEGTRSPAHKLRRFRRGACEAAIQAQVPIVPVFIDVDPPSLLKGQKWHAIPHEMMTFRIEYLPVI